MKYTKEDKYVRSRIALSNDHLFLIKPSPLNRVHDVQVGHHDTVFLYHHFGRSLDGVKMTAQLGTPRGRYDEHSSKSSLSMKPRFIEPVGERTNFRRLMLIGLVTALDNLYMATYLGRSFAPAATWNLHTIQPKYFAPTYSEVVNLTSFL
jgi:hypothetical protein